MSHIHQNHYFGFSLMISNGFDDEIALFKDVPHPSAVRIHLETQREARHQPPPIGIALPDDSRVRNLIIRPHQLEDYDQLQSNQENENNDD